MNETGVANLEDVQLAVLAFQGDFLVSLEAVDIEPCVPNGVVNLADAFFIVTAFQGTPYSDLCEAPCP